MGATRLLYVALMPLRAVQVNVVGLVHCLMAKVIGIAKWFWDSYTDSLFTVLLNMIQSSEHTVSRPASSYSRSPFLFLSLIFTAIRH